MRHAWDISDKNDTSSTATVSGNEEKQSVTADH